MDELKSLLQEICLLAEVNLSGQQIQILNRGCPHTPSGIPNGKMGIYMFIYLNRFLKIGKAGPKSNARFISQPYNPKSSKSNLAKSILQDPEMFKYKLTEGNIKNWIKENTTRIDIFIESDLGIFVLNLLEAFLHCKYRPKYEGYKNQFK